MQFVPSVTFGVDFVEVYGMKKADFVLLRLIRKKQKVSFISSAQSSVMCLNNLTKYNKMGIDSNVYC